MYRLSLYIARQLAAPYAFVLLALISLIIVIPSLRLIDVVLSKGLSPEAFVGLLIAYAPRDLAFALPFLVFLATASAYGRLSLDSELVALQATGRSNLQLMTPAIVFGLLAGDCGTGPGNLAGARGGTSATATRFRKSGAVTPICCRRRRRSCRRFRGLPCSCANASPMGRSEAF